MSIDPLCMLAPVLDLLRGKASCKKYHTRCLTHVLMIVALFVTEGIGREGCTTFTRAGAKATG